MVSASLGSLYYHATQHREKIGNDTKADPHIKDLGKHLEKFDKCQRFNKRHNIKFTHSALVQTAMELQAFGIELQPPCWEVLWQRRVVQLRTEAESPDAVEIFLKACFPIWVDDGQGTQPQGATPGAVELHHIDGENALSKMEMFFETAVDFYLNCWSSMN
eukprot:1752842-Pyramimonas_sp.AAC.1